MRMRIVNVYPIACKLGLHISLLFHLRHHLCTNERQLAVSVRSRCSRLLAGQVRHGVHVSAAQCLPVLGAAAAAALRALATQTPFGKPLARHPLLLEELLLLLLVFPGVFLAVLQCGLPTGQASSEAAVEAQVTLLKKSRKKSTLVHALVHASSTTSSYWSDRHVFSTGVICDLRKSLPYNLCSTSWAPMGPYRYPTCRAPAPKNTQSTTTSTIVET